MHDRPGRRPAEPGDARASETAPPGRPEYGPSGYLPEKAAKRARKIVLRAPLGLQWVLGALAIGVVLAAAAAVFFTRAGPRPGPPFEPVGPVADLGATRYDPQRQVLFVGAAGRPTAFAVPPGDVPIYCPASGRLEAPSGRVWSLTGRALDAGPSLGLHPTVTDASGVLYVDLTRTVPGPPPDRGAVPVCTG